ncbi:MAG: Adenylylsulfate kinase [uncultured Frankineae bacterium]|uniref:Adenylyl-sulfate kinase n=1 Tax=uncultured Frankineae bacterium TaxID=437475 RepID=A0A6J4L8F4_9ACTN|nr:MAG: Adenylylsulfate kinase [uncultured Frankineae bacterium]
MTALDERQDPAAPVTPATYGATVWLTGLPSAGKTTLATALAARLHERGVSGVENLDGDEVREFLSRGLGFSREDRDTNVLRIGWVAATLAKHGVLVLASVISPYAATRQAVRALHDARGAAFLEVHVATPVEVCSERDVKGLYARQRAGDLQGLTGVDAPYEAPTAPDARVPTHEQSLEQSVDQLLAVLQERGLL